MYTLAGLDPLTPLDETLPVLDDLVAAGKVCYIGLTNFPAWQLMKAVALSDARGWARIVAAQYQYSLVMRDIEDEFRPLCLAEGVGLTCWSPLGGGFLSGKYTRDYSPATEAGRIALMDDAAEEVWERRSTARNWAITEQVGRIVEGRGATYPQIALGWLRAQPVVASVIIGARVIAQLDDNLGAADIALSGDELEALTQVSAPPERYPYRFIALSAQRTPNSAGSHEWLRASQ